LRSLYGDVDEPYYYDYPKLPSPTLTGHWSGRGAAAVTGCGRIALALLAPAHHHIDLPAAVRGREQPLAPIENGGAGPRISE
jgi:hypothetical protein